MFKNIFFPKTPSKLDRFVDLIIKHYGGIGEDLMTKFANDYKVNELVAEARRLPYKPMPEEFGELYRSLTDEERNEARKLIKAKTDTYKKDSAGILVMNINAITGVITQLEVFKKMDLFTRMILTLCLPQKFVQHIHF